MSDLIDEGFAIHFAYIINGADVWWFRPESAIAGAILGCGSKASQRSDARSDAVYKRLSVKMEQVLVNPVTGVESWDWTCAVFATKTWLRVVIKPRTR